MRQLPFALALAAAPALSLGLAGCKEKAPSPAAEASASSADEAAGPTAAPGVALSEATVKLPAVAGRPGVAYFTLTQTGGEPHKLAAVHVDGVERSEMHQTLTTGGVSSMQPVKELAIQPGTPLVFKPGGYHVMLFGVGDRLKAGGTTELTISLGNGDKVSIPAKIVSAGDSGEDAMGKMDHM